MSTQSVYKTINNQSIFDVGLQTYTSLDNLIRLLDNNNLSFDITLLINESTNINYDNNLILSSNISNFVKDNAIQLNTYI